MSIEIRGQLSDTEAAAALSLADAAAAADGVAPLSEQVRLDLRYGDDPAASNLLTWRDGALTGFAHLGSPDPEGVRRGELVVHPAHRGHGLGTDLAAATVAEADAAGDASAAGSAGPTAEAAPAGRTGSARSAGHAAEADHEGRPEPAAEADSTGRAAPARSAGHAAEAVPALVRIWAHGDLPAAARLAKTAGFVRVRALWRMIRPLTEGVPDMPPLPDGVTLRSFVPGRDEPAWLTLNARAFASHPEQGRWTPEDIARRENEPWFDPQGFILAERNGRPVGFHWTKIHHPTHPTAPGDLRGRMDPTSDDQEAANGGDGPGRLLGEVYVLGVDPSEQGTGLGKVLTIAGLRHLAAQGVGPVMLYVDEENTAAIRLYERFGFTHTSTDVMYQHTAPTTRP